MATTPVSPAAAVATQTTIKFGGFWRRLIAAAIDLILLGSVATGAVVGAYLLLSGIRPELLAFTILLLFAIFYWPLLESSPLQATLGKRLLGLKVVDAVGGRIGFLQALWRFTTKFISALPLMIGFLRIGWTQRHCATHDDIAKTFVVRRAIDADQFRNEIPPVNPRTEWQGPVAGSICTALFLAFLIHLVVSQMPELRGADEPLLTGQGARPIE